MIKTIPSPFRFFKAAFFKKNRFFLFLASLILFVEASGFPALQESPGSESFPVSTFELKNGLQVILSEDYSMPLVSVAVAYRVGSRHEPKGKTGLAHLLEVMMFQGSRNVRPMQHIRYIQRLGGQLNARTGLDRTLFFQTVPSNQLATVLWLESDRMLSLDITQANVNQARENILDEIRRNQRRPFYATALQFDSLLYPNPDVHHPVTGYERDVRELELEEVRRFFETYYRPNNAVLCVTGHINKSETVRLIRRYFESIPRGEEIPKIEVSPEVEREGITESMPNPLSASPGFYLGYRLPPPSSPDYYAAVILEYVLFQGESGRVSKRLLERDRTAVRMNGRIETRGGETFLRMFVLCANLYTRERSWRGIQSEINRLKTQLISEKELTKAKNLLRRDYLRRRASASERVLYLLETYLEGRDLRDLPGEMDRYLEVSPARVGAIVHRYFNQQRILLNFGVQ